MDIYILLGFVLLFFGGELIVRGSVSLAFIMKISKLVVGMTVLAFATSAPELFVSLQAVFEGSSNIALGNAIGSNIANIALVLGFTAMIFRVKISKKTLTLNYPIMFFTSLLLGLVLYLFSGIPFFIGCLFVIILSCFIYFLIVNSKNELLNQGNSKNELQLEQFSNSLFKSVLLLILGIFSLKYGADFLVDSTRILAKNLGISDRIIAVTVVAIGTSIPELATSVIAAFKKEENLAVGNLIGSNIFNILAVLGITAAVKSINIDDNAIFFSDYFWMMLITFLLGFLIYTYSKQYISRKEGAFLVAMYLLYLYFTLV